MLVVEIHKKRRSLNIQVIISSRLLVVQETIQETDFKDLKLFDE